MQPIRDRLGICQWFHHDTHAEAERAVDLLKELGVRHLRTGISWADFYRPNGKDWYDWLLPRLADFEILLSVWHVPPSISEDRRCASPPRVLKDYADFIDQVIDLYGDYFDHLELWNEPNNLYKWDFARWDPHWAKFGRMVNMAGYWAKHRGKPTVLGGMIPVDHRWLSLMDGYGVLEHVDVVAIHAFPQMWWHDAPCWDQHARWDGWSAKVQYIRGHANGRPIWVTETGLATWDVARAGVGRFALQAKLLNDAACAPAERVYWYCLTDLPADREAIEGFHVDENEYHLGLLTSDGRKKPAWWVMRDLMLGA